MGRKGVVRRERIRKMKNGSKTWKILGNTDRKRWKENSKKEGKLRGGLKQTNQRPTDLWACT